MTDNEKVGAAVRAGSDLLIGGDIQVRAAAFTLQRDHTWLTGQALESIISILVLSFIQIIHEDEDGGLFFFRNPIRCLRDIPYIVHKTLDF